MAVTAGVVARAQYHDRRQLQQTPALVLSLREKNFSTQQRASTTATTAQNENGRKRKKKSDETIPKTFKSSKR